MAKTEKKEETKDKSTPKSLQDLIKAVQTKTKASIIHGKGPTIRVESFPSGLATLDQALGCGGVPRGRIIEIYGHNSHGKTSLTLQIAASCQQTYFEDRKRNGVVGFIDAEHSLDPAWAANLGVKFDDMLLLQPDSGEQVFDVIQQYAKSGLIDLVIVDSVAALQPISVLEGEIEDANIGAQAQLLSKGIRRIVADCKHSKMTVIFINQIRNKIGVRFGNPETTPGGEALRFYSSVRLEIKRQDQIKSGDSVVAHRIKCRVVKNKVARPFTEAETEIWYGDGLIGFHKIKSLLEAAVEADVVKLAGSHYSFESHKLGNGLEKALENLEKLDPEVLSKLTAKVYEQIKPDHGAIRLEDMGDNQLVSELREITDGESEV